MFLAKEPQKGMGEQSEANPEQTRQREARLPADEKRNLEETRQAFHNFLQRNSQKGWASEAKPIPNKKNATAFLFLAKELPKGMGEQSEANPKQEKRDSGELGFA